MSEPAPILPGATLGVLGGGQLGRMFAQAATRMGYRVAVLAPGKDTPTGQVAALEFDAAYDDADAVEAFARTVDVVTFEFENVPAEAAEAAARHAPVRPAGGLLWTVQNRLRERELLDRLGLPCAGHAPVLDPGDARAAADHVGVPGVLKTAAWGYDGKGQARVTSLDGIDEAWRGLGGVPCLYEAFIDYTAEISVVGVRGLDGALGLYEPTLNLHVSHILDVSVVPAPLPRDVRDEARRVAAAVFEGLELVGVACVEMFVHANGEVLVNEIAPRPHNSGHLTIEASETSQFESQVRAVCGLPLGSLDRVVGGAAMANVLGDLWTERPPRWEGALACPATRLHLYGKREARAGRKMGHLTATAGDPGEAERRVRRARAALTEPR